MKCCGVLEENVESHHRAKDPWSWGLTYSCGVIGFLIVLALWIGVGNEHHLVYIRGRQFGTGQEAGPRFGSCLNTTIGENVKIGARVKIGCGAEIGSSVSIGNNVKIGPAVKIGDHSVILSGVTLVSTTLGAGSLVGCSSDGVPCNVTLKDCTVEPEAVVIGRGFIEGRIYRGTTAYLRGRRAVDKSKCSGTKQDTSACCKSTSNSILVYSYCLNTSTKKYVPILTSKKKCTSSSCKSSNVNIVRRSTSSCTTQLSDASFSFGLQQTLASSSNFQITQHSCLTGSSRRRSLWRRMDSVYQRELSSRRRPQNEDEADDENTNEGDNNNNDAAVVSSTSTETTSSSTDSTSSGEVSSTDSDGTNGNQNVAITTLPIITTLEPVFGPVASAETPTVTAVFVTLTVTVAPEVTTFSTFIYSEASAFSTFTYSEASAFSTFTYSEAPIFSTFTYSEVSASSTVASVITPVISTVVPVVSQVAEITTTTRASATRTTTVSPVAGTRTTITSDTSTTTTVAPVLSPVTTTVSTLASTLGLSVNAESGTVLSEELQEAFENVPYPVDTVSVIGFVFDEVTIESLVSGILDENSQTRRYLEQHEVYYVEVEGVIYPIQKNEVVLSISTECDNGGLFDYNLWMEKFFTVNTGFSALHFFNKTTCNKYIALSSVCGFAETCNRVNLTFNGPGIVDTVVYTNVTEDETGQVFTGCQLHNPATYDTSSKLQKHSDFDCASDANNEALGWCNLSDVASTGTSPTTTCT